MEKFKIGGKTELDFATIGIGKDFKEIIHPIYLGNARYKAVLRRENGSDWCISFPNYEGCISAGLTIQEAIEMGTEALELHLEGEQS